MPEQQSNYGLSENACGKCLIAAKDLEKGIIVEHWEGTIIDSYEKVPDSMKIYVILIDDTRWLAASNDAMYANHSCEPNCEVDDDLNIVTIKPVKEGEELCFDYAVTYDGEHPYPWQPEWTFNCKCGSPKCRGMIDKYVNEDGTPYTE